MEKDSIDKINEQIENLLNEGKNNDKENDSHEVIVDKKYEYDDIGSTKKIDSIEEIDVEDCDEETKKIDTINDIKEEEPIEEEPKEEIINKEEKPNEENNKKDDKNNNKKQTIIIIIVFAILAIFCTIFILIFALPSKDTKTSKVTKKKVLSEKKIIDGYGDALKGIIGVTYEKDKKILEYDEAIKLVKYDHKVICDEHEIYEDGLIYLDKCSIDGKKTKYSYGEKQEKKEEPKISEDAIKVYVSKKGGKATLDKPKNEDDYDVYHFEINGKYSGLELLDPTSDYVFYMDEEYNTHMINFKTGNKIFESMNYSSVLPIKLDEVYDTNYVAVGINNKWGIYKISTNERVVANKYDTVTPMLYMGTSGPSSCVTPLEDGIVAVANYGANNSEYGIVNYHTGKEILPLDYKQMLKSGNYLWTVDSYSDGHIFDYHGNEYLKDKYDTIYWIVDGKYILVKDSENIKLVSIKGKEIYNYENIEVGRINYGLTYKDGALFQFDNPNKKDENSSCLEIIYDSNEKKGKVKESYCGGIAKPILYLYPNKTTKVNVTFEHPEYLKTTYPKFNGSWEVSAHSNGDLYDNKGNYYYGLYWDELKVHDVDFSTGYYVEKDNAIEFLEKKLSYIGLSPREKNEFIMYWLPVLERNEKSLVYFELTEERESYSKINISPKPDSLLRLVIHIKKVDKKVDIPKQSLTKFQRKGFVAVEWGGTNY